MKLNLFTNIGLRTSLHEIHESFASDVVDKAVLLTLLCRRSQEGKGSGMHYSKNPRIRT